MKILFVAITALLSLQLSASEGPLTCVNADYGLEFSLHSVSSTSYIISDSNMEGLENGLELFKESYKTWFLLKSPEGKVLANLDLQDGIHIYVPHPHGLRMSYDFECNFYSGITSN